MAARTKKETEKQDYNLVIVESPAKAKTIEKFLGAGYKVTASNGRLIDLPKSKIGVDIENDFEPNYIVIRGRTQILNGLKKEAKTAKRVYLATDPDREGEAISWHIAKALEIGEGEQCRIEFNEITENAVKTAIQHPRTIDINKVNAQQARRVLDRLVGYKLSPLLWSKVRRGLSAGRVQSVAVRLIVDRENEIRDFKPREFWTIFAIFTDEKGKHPFEAKFFGKKGKKLEPATQEETEQIVSEIQAAEYRIEKVKKSTKQRRPYAPFTTSTLQQDAARKLGFTTKRTMMIAQGLYEGVKISETETVGLITYMRTDSLRISEDAIREATEYIETRWGGKYLPSKPRHFKSRANAQDGHEAIRPASIAITPEAVKDSLTADQYKLYKLIWERFIACQMANCVLNTTQATISAGKYIFKASGFNVAFEGFTALYEESKDEEEKAGKDLPPLEEGMKLKVKDLKGNQHFTQPPPRFTEASLIKTLEENGIGRPSTYAATISTITSREYVIREGKAFKPTELGEVITKLMKERFPKIVNVKFTAQVEDELDSVQRGDEEWVETLRRFYDDFDKTVQAAKKDMDGVKIRLKEDETDVICEKCGRNMVVKVGRYGKFLACPGYPECKNIKKIVNDTGAACPKCGGKIIERKSKKGRVFYGCSEYPKCDFVSWDPPSKEKCPVCGKTLLQKKSKDKTLYCVTPDCSFEGKKPADTEE